MNDAEPEAGPLTIEQDAHPDYPLSLGALWQDTGVCHFRVWAPCAEQVDVILQEPDSRPVPMEKLPRGYFVARVANLQPGTRYMYRLNGRDERPDPASRYQPDGVHRASSIVDPRFPWTDRHWKGIALHDYVTYELHVGTFTEQGTLDAAIARLDDLVELGVTAVELMPLAQFPGARNWGYDGVHPFAVQNTYGGPDALRRFVDACHHRGLAVVVDVVYNHLGPEGNYLGQFGHYFTERFRTPWGQAVNYDDEHSDEVRRFFIENALYWIGQCHVDALRLDAIHAIFDFSARHFLEELADAVRLEGLRLGRQVYTIAESSLNDARIITPKQLGGWGLDAQWNDDFHHALHVTRTGERDGYFSDFQGSTDVVRALTDGFVLHGQYSNYRGRRHGKPLLHVDPVQLVVCSQNHDQVGNRLLGERISQLTGFEHQKWSAALVLLSPNSPMLFMGEEYGETAPFQYFVSHGDPQLVENVRRGRQEEFARFQWHSEPPDPQSPQTFEACRLNWSLKDAGQHQTLWQLYQRLIALRKAHPSLRYSHFDHMDVERWDDKHAAVLRRWCGSEQNLLLINGSERVQTVTYACPASNWVKRLDTSDVDWRGPGSQLPERLGTEAQEIALRPWSVALYVGDAG